MKELNKANLSTDKKPEEQEHEKWSDIKESFKINYISNQQESYVTRE